LNAALRIFENNCKKVDEIMNVIRPKILVLGSISYDFILETPRLPIKGERTFGKFLGKVIGGMAANQALQVANFLGESYLIGKVGKGDDGQTILKALNKNNINTSFVAVDCQDASGIAWGCLAENDWIAVVTPNSNWNITDDELLTAIDHFGEGDYLIVQLEIRPESALLALRKAKEKGLTTVLCSSPTQNVLHDMFKYTDILIMNRQEANEMWGVNITSMSSAIEIVKNLDSNVADLVLVTLGDQGCLLKTTKNIFTSPAMPVSVMSTVGAGDALTGAFISALAMGFDYHQALAFGSIAGSLAVSTIELSYGMRTYAKYDEIKSIYSLNEEHFATKACSIKI
jgi:ribokinase